MTRHTQTPPAGDSPLTITRHPPEHGPAGTPDILPGACCCCCCCCLHTLGGVIGAIVGSVNHIDAAPVRMNDPDSPFPFRRDVFEDEEPVLPAAALYWMLVAFLMAVTVGVTCFNMTSGGGPGFSGQMLTGVYSGLFIGVMILPALQLGASLLSLLAIALFYPSRSLPLKRVGKITLWSFTGSILGMILMGGCCGIFYAASR